MAALRPDALRRRVVLAALCALLAQGVLAREPAAVWSGTVVAIADGDTVTVLDEQRVQHHIRLAAIDAPERTQPYSQKSRQHLADLVFRKIVAVHPITTDRYGRDVARLMVEQMDVGLAQIQPGYAWHFERFALKDPQLRAAYAAAESEARAARRGLWASPDPEPPWDFRARQRAAAATAPR